MAIITYIAGLVIFTNHIGLVYNVRSLAVVRTHIVETFTVGGISGFWGAIAILPTLTKGSKITPENYGCPLFILLTACYIKEVLSKCKRNF